MKKIIAAALLTLGLAASPALAKGGIKVGMLTCSVEGGVGWIIGSSKGIDCVYQPSGGGKIEHYSGQLGKLGIDIGVTGQTTIAWVVFAPGKIDQGSLKGQYTGVSAEATVIGGLGANVLIGGFRKSINLQPLSIQAQTGLNIAGGIGSLTLESN